MTAPVLPPRTGWRRADRPSVPTPQAPARPAQCAYCGEGPANVLCGPEHTAYAGEWLCSCCYARLLEGPVLGARHDAAQG
jgi:hypothetical protein